MIYHCAACDVRWRSAGDCFICGTPGSWTGTYWQSIVMPSNYIAENASAMEPYLNGRTGGPLAA